MHIRFPELVECASNFIKDHSFAAHSRRRETTGTGTGLCLNDLKNHLLEHVPGLKEHGISCDTIHHLMVPPRKNSGRAHRYKGLIDAKIPKKRNDYREDSENQHFLFARVKYREEFVAKYEEECCFYSCDDMNKLRLSPSPAVSRYHQQFRFFMQDDQPNLNDHDFPNPGYLLVPSGYQRLEIKDGVEKDFIVVDEHDLFENPNEGFQMEEEIDVDQRQRNGFSYDKLK